MSITRNFDLYLTAGKSIPLVINANQYDESEEWVFTLYTDTGVKYTPSSGSIVGIKSDGYLIANAGTVDGQGRVVITETQQMTASAGKAIFELQIDNETHGTANFIVLVEPDPANNGTVSGSDIGLLRQALNGGLSQDAIDALLACFENVAWIGDDGQDYYDALEAALNAVRGISLDVSTLSFVGAGQTQQLTATTVPAGGTVSWESSNTSVATVSSSGLVTSAGVGTATITASSGDVTATCSVSVVQATLVSISAVYTQSGTVYNTDSLDSLKSDLVVTATWSNSTTSTVASADYTLSGTLTVGTSTITVSYGGKTATFNVTVTEFWDVAWEYTDGVPTDFGFTISTSNGTYTMTEDGYKVQTNANTTDANCRPTTDFDPTSGTFETVLRWTSVPPLSMGSTIGGVGWGISIFGDKLWFNHDALGNNTNAIEVMSISTNTDYTIKCEFTPTVAKVYVNGTLMYTHNGSRTNTRTRYMCNLVNKGGISHYIKAIRLHAES